MTDSVVEYVTKSLYASLAPVLLDLCIFLAISRINTLMRRVAMQALTLLIFAYIKQPKQLLNACKRDTTSCIKLTRRFHNRCLLTLLF